MARRRSNRPIRVGGKEYIRQGGNQRLQDRAPHLASTCLDCPPSHFKKEIKKLLVANRSEIAIRVFRSAHELGIRTVAIYSHKDRYALHRFKADEAYLIGKPDEPIRAYLDIEWIVSLARENEVDAIHPGYGFLSENPDFARACEREGIIFVGPQVEVLERLGDKIAARKIATDAGVPVLGGSEETIADVAEGERQAEEVGYPVIRKAAKGGGGRGMRVVSDRREFPDAFEDARRESLAAFGNADVFIERFVQKARHIEVQLLGDKHGNLVHLFERDCSLQRRHQKGVEMAPALALDEDVRQSLLDAAVAIGREVGYQNAGTVEFLVDQDEGDFYFIEVNPRIQVEHTVTEEVTGVDLVKAQCRIADAFAGGLGCEAHQAAEPGGRGWAAIPALRRPTAILGCGAVATAAGELRSMQSPGVPGDYQLSPAAMARATPAAFFPCREIDRFVS